MTDQPFRVADNFWAETETQTLIDLITSFRDEDAQAEYDRSISAELALRGVPVPPLPAARPVATVTPIRRSA